MIGAADGATAAGGRSCGLCSSHQFAADLRTHKSLREAEAVLAGTPLAERVFSTSEGEPIRDDAFRREVWARILRRATLRYRKPHALRNSLASLLIEAGGPPTYIQQQLNHHSPAFTLAVYDHLQPRGDRRAVDHLDDPIPEATIRNPRATYEPGEKIHGRDSESWTSLYLICHSRSARGEVAGWAEMTYSHPQLKLLLVVAAVCLAGLGVREWRAGFPDAAERLERFDREDPPPPIPPAPRSRAAPRWAAARTEPPAPAGAVPPPRTRANAAPVAPVADPRPLDLNRASADEISRLPGVGPSLARRIVEERDRRGRFETSENLRGILGMGPKKLAALREHVTVGD